jgi:hypothetical protein
LLQKASFLYLAMRMFFMVSFMTAGVFLIGIGIGLSPMVIPEGPFKEYIWLASIIIGVALIIMNTNY